MGAICWQQKKWEKVAVWFAFRPVLPYVVGMKIDCFATIQKAKDDLAHTQKMLRENKFPEERPLLKDHEQRLLDQLEKHKTVNLGKRWRFINRFAD